MRKCNEKTLHSIARARKGDYDFVPKFQPPPRINGIHDIVRPIVQDAQRKMYKDMNDYMENIFNAPSTINRIMKYYHRANIIGDDKEYIGFVNSDNNIVEIVQEYDIDKYVHAEEIRQRIELEMQSNLVILKPSLICYIPK